MTAEGSALFIVSLTDMSKCVEKGSVLLKAMNKGRFSPAGDPLPACVNRQLCS